MRPPGSICIKRLFLLSSMLWLLTGSQVWAEEEETETRAPSWFARIEIAAAAVITEVTELVEDPVDEFVAGIESALVDPAQDAMSGSLTNVEELIEDPIEELVTGFRTAISDPLEDAVGRGQSDFKELVRDPADELVVGIGTAIADPAENLLSEMNELVTVPVTELATGIGAAIAVPIDIAKVEVVSGAHELLVIPVDNALTEIEEVVVDSTGYAIKGVVIACQDFVVVPVDNTLIRFQQTLGDATESVKSAIPVEALARVPETLEDVAESVMPAIPMDMLSDIPQRVADYTASALPAIPVGAERAVVVAGNTWDELSYNSQRKFFSRGWRIGMRWRTPAMAESLYETIPRGVREMGEEAVVDFLEKYELSHIKSVKYFPELAEDLDNVIWEVRKANRARGARTMTDIEVATAKRALLLTGFKVVATTVAKGAAVGAAMESPVVALENYLHYHNGRKNADEAILDAAVSMAVAGAASGAATYAAPFAISGLASAGITVSIGVLATPVMVGGIVVYAGYSGYRLCKAAQPELLESPSFLPLHYIK